jgi:Protein of unknown function (DUF3047)
VNRRQKWQNGLYSCDSNVEYAVRSSRGYLRKLHLFGAIGALGIIVFGITGLMSQVHASPLAYIALNRATLNPGEIPQGWQIKVNHGRPDVSICSDIEGPCLHLKSTKASFGLERDMDLDPAQMPFLNWSWKVAQLPAGGDFRHASTDDQAAQVLVAFADRRIVSYIWDSSAPKGMVENASFIPFVHVFDVVCESGASDLNRWVKESHNVAADYQRVYGKSAPRVKGLRIQINSQHTGSVAESYFGDVTFRSALQ